MNRRVALVTGGARRIGAAIVNHLHQYGFNVALHCHQSTFDAQTVVNKLNSDRADSAIWFSCDLCEMGSPAYLLQHVIHWAGRLDVLVNNASLFSREAEWDRMFTLNTKVPYDLSQGAYPLLEKTKGCIVNITDIHATLPLKGYSVYCQSKAALWMQTKSLAQAFAPSVRVNAVAPGAIAWPEAENALNDAQQKKIVAKTPLKRHGDPLYIAEATLALINQTFVTGQCLAVDGGRSLSHFY
jgi:pteridine reductase